MSPKNRHKNHSEVAFFFFLLCALKKQKKKKLSSRNCKLYNGMTVWFSKEGNHISASALGFGLSDVGFVVFMFFGKFEKTKRTKPVRD